MISDEKWALGYVSNMNAVDSTLPGRPSKGEGAANAKMSQMLETGSSEKVMSPGKYVKRYLGKR